MNTTTRHVTFPQVAYGHVEVDGVQVSYRAAGPAGAPVLLLLHGFPSASHQFRRLIDALGDRYRLVAPDYPGFGQTRTPAGFDYSFESLTDAVEGFVRALGLTRFVLYAFDFGGPVGFRLATRDPGRIAGLVIQNANLYEEGLSDAARSMIANRPGVAGAEDRVRELLTLAATRSQYEVGAADPTRIAPDGWTLDQHFLDQPGRKDAQVALALDYHSNLAHYPAWQRYLREHQPPALIVWGRHDPIFIEAGARAYLRDLPDAELHLYDTGHFALEERLDEIAPRIAAFLDRVWRTSLKVAVIGATGNLGGVAAAEAAARGHQVSRLSRADVDITDVDSVRSAVAGHDAVIVAVKGTDRTVPRAARALLDALPAVGVDRLVFIGGGGSLLDPAGRPFIDAPDFPPQYLATARDQAEALDTFRAADTAVDWSYASPPPRQLVPGERTGRYRAEARDTPLTDANGDSRVTTADYAAAVVDAIERGSFIRQRFTVAY